MTNEHKEEGILKFESYFNTELYIQQRRIIAFSEASLSTPNDPQTMLFISCENTCEEWIVREDVKEVLRKIKEKEYE